MVVLADWEHISSVEKAKELITQKPTEVENALTIWLITWEEAKNIALALFAMKGDNDNPQKVENYDLDNKKNKGIETTLSTNVLDLVQKNYDIMSSVPPKLHIETLDDIEKHIWEKVTFEDAYTFTPELVKLFGMLTWDLNPIHHDEKFKDTSILWWLAVHGHFLNAITGGCVHKLFNVPENAPYEITSKYFTAGYPRPVSITSPVTMHRTITEVKDTDNRAGKQVTFHIVSDAINTRGKPRECCKFDWTVEYYPLARKEIALDLATMTGDKDNAQELENKGNMKNNTENKKELLTEKFPSKIDWYLAQPNPDGSFDVSSAMIKYREGASIFAFEPIEPIGPIGNRRFNVYVCKEDASVKLAVDRNLEPVFTGISAPTSNTKTIQTVKPAVVRLDPTIGKFILMHPGQIDYDGKGMERENNE